MPLFCILWALRQGTKEVERVKRSEQDGEQLREKLLDDVYAGAFAGGVPAMLLEEEEIRGADDEKLEEIAERHGLK